jgi:RHS repeat-associated protein
MRNYRVSVQELLPYARAVRGWIMRGMVASAACSSAIGAMPGVAAAQNPHPDFGGTPLPPIVTITPFGGAFTTPRVGVTITICDSIAITSHSMSLNGGDVTGLFPLVTQASQPGCHFGYAATDTIVLASGSNTLQATALSVTGGGNVGTDTVNAVFTYAPLAITVTANTAAETVAPSTAAVAVFKVTNTGVTTESPTFAASCPAPTASCTLSSSGATLSVGQTVNDTIHLTTGSTAGMGAVRLTATVTGTPTGATDAAETDITVETRVAHGVQLNPVYPGTLRDPGYCLELSVRPGASISCGDFRYVHAAPAVRTYNKVRAPVLIYQSQAAHPFLIVPALVTADTSHGAPDSVHVRLNENGTRVDSAFLPGASFAHGVTQRVLLGVDEGSATNSSISYTVEATTYAGASTTSDSVGGAGEVESAHFSHVGRGWMIAGVEQLKVYPLLGASKDSSGLLWATGGGDVRYYQVVASARYLWRTDSLNRRDSIRYDSTLKHYTRFAAHGVRVVFDTLGRQDSTIDRLGHVTRFAYTTATGFDIDHITLPVALASDTTTFRYTFYYGSSSYLDSITAPGPSGGTRKVTLIHDSGGNVLSLKDPDGLTDSLTYLSSPATLLNAFRDKRGTWATVKYDSGLKVRTVTVDTAGASALKLQTTVIAQQSKSFHGALNPDSAYTTLADPDGNVSRLWLDRYSGPVRIQGPLGTLTLIARTNPHFPGAVTRLKRPNGQVLGATYDSRGNIASEADSSSVLGGVTATTTYQFDQVWDFVTVIDPPAQDTIKMAYDATTGNRLYQQDARGVSSRATFGYSTTLGLLTTFVDPLGNTGQVGYDAIMGNMDTTTTQLGTKTIYVRDAVGRLIVTRSPFDTGTAFHTTDSLTYDAMDRPLAEIVSAPAYNGISAESAFVRSVYDPEGAADTVRRSQDPDPPGIGTLLTSTKYDAVGRAIKAVAVDGHNDSMVYDAVGNLLQRVSPRADTVGGARYVIVATYDSLNRVMRRIVPQASYRDTTTAQQMHLPHFNADLTQFPYYPNSGPGSLTYTIPADTELYNYDAVSELTQADNRDAQVRRSYNKNGTIAIDSLRIRTVAPLTVDSGGNFTVHQYALRFLYDIDGRRIGLIHPPTLEPTGVGTSNQYVYTYNAFGSLSDIYDFYNNHTHYSYDLDSRIDSIVQPGAIIQTYVYDAESRVTGDSVSNISGFPTSADSAHDQPMLRATKLSYDLRGKVRSAVNSYQVDDNVTEMYSGLGQISQTVTSFRYLDVGVIPRAWFSYSRWELSHVDAFGDKLSDTAQTNRGLWFTWAFQWDSGTTSVPYRDTTKYQHNTGRVASFRPSYDVGPDSLNHEVYQFDEKGNMRFSALATGALSLNDTMKVQARYYGADDRLRAADTRTTQYPVNGAEAFNTNAGGSFEEYRYDALGRRIWVRNRATCWAGQNIECYLSTVRRTVWDGDAELYEIQAPGDTNASVAEMETDTVHFDTVKTLMPPHSIAEQAGDPFDRTPWYGRVVYVHGLAVDRPVEIVRLGLGVYKNPGDTTSYIGYDHMVWSVVYNWQGNADNGSLASGWLTTGFTALGGSLFWPTPWAPEFTQWGGPFQYLGVWWGTLAVGKQDQSGQSYRRNRYYDGLTGQFTQEDPLGLGGGINAYGFAGGDPVNYDDPFGLDPCHVSGNCTQAQEGIDKAAAHATRDLAARAGMQSIYTESVAEDREYVGDVVKENSGDYNYTAGIRQGREGSEVDASVPGYEGYYHSHGAPSNGVFDDEHFSDRDKRTADRHDKPGYVVTPSGRMLRYDPTPYHPTMGGTTEIGTVHP